MPSTYAHYRFGRDVIAAMDKGVCKDIVDNLDEYNIGLHGPDILFYYDALKRNNVNSRGFAMHEEPGRNFFAPARDILDTMEKKDAGRAYLFGFICHFVLDSECHPYIEERIHESGIAHTKIESEFDRMLLEMDGFDPVRKCLTPHIHPSPEISETISPFFPGISAGEVEKSLRDMISYNDLLCSPGRLKRYLIDRKLKVTGNYDDMHGLLIGLKPDPACEDSNDVLMSKYTASIRIAADLMFSYSEYLSGESELSERFDRTFSVD